MSVVEDIHQIVHDFLAPELRAMTARMDVSDRANEARWASAEKTSEARHSQVIAEIAALTQKVEMVSQKVGNSEHRLSDRFDRLTQAFEFDKRIAALEKQKVYRRETEEPAAKRV
jgi:hypothetical protein